MRILAASIVEKVGTYMHPGYGSTSPRPFDPWYAPSGAPDLSLDMVEALRLESGPTALAGSLEGQEAGLALVVVSVFAALGLAYHLGGRTSRRRVALQAVPLGWSAILGVALALGAAGPGPAHASDASVRYANPELATRAIIHGLIADAIVDAGGKQTKIGSLEDLRDEIGIPAADPTPGMRHALEHYETDGWGRPLRLKGGWAVGYLVWSAGEDGKFKTADDIKTRVRLTGEYDWDEDREAFYVTKEAGRLVVLFHAWRGYTFEYHDRDKALQIAGSSLYDVVPLKKFDDPTRTTLGHAYKKAAKKADHDPLVLVSWPRS
jgi:hypothetical protein